MRPVEKLLEDLREAGMAAAAPYIYPDGWYANRHEDMVRCEFCDTAVCANSKNGLARLMAQHRSECPR